MKRINYQELTVEELSIINGGFPSFFTILEDIITGNFTDVLA